MSELDAVSADLFSVVCNSSAAAVDAFLTSHPTLPVDVQNDKGDTPLIMAARRGDIDVVRTLLKAGASIHTRNLKGSNPLIAVHRANTQTRNVPGLPVRNADLIPACAGALLLCRAR